MRHAATLLLLLARGATSAGFRPQSIPYAELVDGGRFAGGGWRRLFEEALSGVGAVTVAGIPGYGALRREVLEGAHGCIQVLPPELARGHVFEDGTVRRTLAMATGAAGAGGMPDGGLAACEGLQARMAAFRALVAAASLAFAARLGDVLELGVAASDGYATAEELFSRGEQLEHVHAYHLPAERQGSGASTMELHTDQGLGIAFTPALLVEVAAGGARAAVGPTGSFELQLRSGERVVAELPEDELVFLLGDGVKQYVNPRLRSGPELRPAPHALVMPAHAANQWRLWYGRMLLPPADAVSERGLAFGGLQGMLEEAWVSEDEALEPRLALGCSPGLRARELRELSEDPPCSSGSRRRCSGSCANNQLQCWWRCMNFTADVGPAACAAKGSGFNCTNRRDEISIGGQDHGDYDLACTNSTQPVQPNCALPQINAARPATCSAAGFETFLSQQGAFAGRHDLRLDADGAPEVVFLWSPAGGQVRGVMAYNGKVSWIAWGIENIGGKHNGMNGGSVLLGISDADQEFPALAGVHEYRVHDTETRFRLWNTPYASPAATAAELLSEGCYTAMNFTVSSIHGEPLNVTAGTNRLIWAIRSSTYMHVGKDSYHEGCNGQERTRNRGGGELNPWLVDFSDTRRQTVDPAAQQVDPATQQEDQVGSGGRAGAGLALLLAAVRAVPAFTRAG